MRKGLLQAAALALMASGIETVAVATDLAKVVQKPLSRREYKDNAKLEKAKAKRERRANKLKGIK